MDVFPSAHIIIETDLLAAARSLLKDKEGFVAILGTGTNSCIYDGKKVTANIESLGFLLGDEGSGSYIGKKLISDYIREVMPDSVRNDFFNTFQLTGIELLNKVYQHPVANRYCGSFAKFVGDQMKKDPYYYGLVNNVFHDFFRNIVIRYPTYQDYSFNCIGSIAYHFRDVLEIVVSEYGMKMGNIIKEPMKGLISYHCKELKR
jgi:glucosamine kinase